MATTVTTECRRCNGTGIWAGRGECFGCNAAGTRTHARYTADEKAARKLLAARTISARDLVKARACELAGGRRNSDLEWDANYGFGRLRDEEPERFLRMLDSVEAGRVDSVVHGLVAFYQAAAA